MKPIKFSIVTFSAFLLLLISVSCGKKEFKVKGEIYGASKALVVLQKADFNGRWLTIDSTRTSSSGNFHFNRPSLQAPEIFRLVYDDRYIYFPVDSTETIKLETDAKSFGTKFALSGSENAVLMSQFDQELTELPSNFVPDSLNNYKKLIFTKYIHPNPASIVSYYILTKEVNGKPLFSPNSNEDFKYFAAVATGYKNLRPDDPRTELLTQTSMDAMKRKNSEKGKVWQIEAEEVSIIDIELPDEKGVPQKLSDIAGKGKPVVLAFALLTAEDSPTINYDLARLKNNKPNIDIYHVSLDPDRYAWRDAAVNLPWITVFDSDGEYSKAASAYNVFYLPTFFIYDASGNLQDRVTSVEELRKKL